MKIVYAGTPEFAVPCLDALRAAGHEILSVYTQPDRAAGRGRKVSPSPVKRYAASHGLEIHQPVTLKTDSERAHLQSQAADVMIVVAYGMILPEPILAIPRLGCLNVHASLLPRWRGAAPIPRAIAAGDRETGITIMQMDEGLDTGAILDTAVVSIEATDTAQSLHDRLAPLGATTLLGVLNRLAQGSIEPRAQEHARACYAAKLRKDEAPIDWRLNAADIHRKIRAFNPWPVAQTLLRGTTLRIWDVAPVIGQSRGDAKPGTVLKIGSEGINVRCADGVVSLTRVQSGGGRVLTAAEFLNGHALQAGERLGPPTQRDGGA